MSKEVKKKTTTTKKTTTKKTTTRKPTTKKGSKKKVNKKGFTLVEILAMLVILAIILAISVPNITGILSKQKESISLEDANKLVETTKIKVRTKADVTLPSYNQYCNIYTMNFLDTNDDYSTGSNGGEYDKLESFVIVKKVVTDQYGNPKSVPAREDIIRGELRNYVKGPVTVSPLSHKKMMDLDPYYEDETDIVTYEYYIRLYEVVDGEAMGVKLVKLENLEKDIKSYMTTFDKKVGISDVADVVTVKNAIDGLDTEIQCAEIERIFVSGEVTIKDARDDCWSKAK